MKIPFSLPVIDADVIAEMHDTLTNTGWLTSGPKVQALEKELELFIGGGNALCVNSWTSGAMLVLRWFGVGPGDEVIIPSYTYSATALCVMNLGATPVMVDVKEDLTIDANKMRMAVTSKTKAVIPVDLGGYPCDYDAIKEVVNAPEIKELFISDNEKQEMLGRILILSDSAHSLGATYKGVPCGLVSDVTVFSFHSVKNITTGEGGGIVVNLPEPFDNAKELAFLRVLSLNGQNKSAFEKNQIGGWKYDIIDQGLKINMPDLCATVGLAQIRKYKNELLPDRKKIYNYYVDALSSYNWAIIPPFKEGSTESSYHLFLLRISDISEEQRDEMIRVISEKEVGVNVHYIPMPMLTLFKNKGYKMADYPVTYDLYKNEISLPVYNGLTEEKLHFVVDTVVAAYKTISGN
ncbi:DegT/DnrJ/EryC1/StrS family aminotransferase [uncultured Bacteroides sp.]|uniref:DegT/DnrJ/EryC1/StrS family aminotransferase n=1 Tax=uncultured Bacteroides sp. TaxID=162156 RepID=UPI002AAB2B72|nr:DegT/DnrJ/EryC1/StrS family aminotransferase [uncultured Bacteroides sp.]